MRRSLVLLMLWGIMLADNPSAVVADIQGSQPDVRVLKSDTQSIIVELGHPEFVTREKTIGRDTCVSLQVPGYAQTTQEGWPQLPTTSVMLGIPPEAKIQLVVLENDESVLPGQYAVCPAPTALVDFGVLGPEGIPLPTFVGQEFVKDPIAYESDAFYPANVASIVEDGFIRQQRFVRLQLSPFRYNAVSRQISVQQRLVAKLEFTYPQGVESVSWTDDVEVSGFEEILQQSLVNYDTARHWRASKLANRKITAAEPESPSPGYRIYVDQDSIYEMMRADLPGLPADVDPRTFQIFSEGQEIAIYVDGEEDGDFSSTDYILFFGERLVTKYTDQNVYWLTYGNENGRRMPEKSGAPSGNAAVALSSPDTQHLERDIGYWPLMPGTDDHDRWYWTYAIAPHTLDHTAVLSNPVSSSYSGTLRVSIYGYSGSGVNPDHHVELYMNSTWIGEDWWDGAQSHYLGEFEFRQDLLTPGDNVVTVKFPGDTGASSEANIIDWFEIDYQNRHIADGDYLRFGSDQAIALEYRVSGFSGSDIELFDVTDPLTPGRVIDGLVETDGVSYTLRFEDIHIVKADYIAELPSKKLSPSAIVFDRLSNWRTTTHGADYIVITPDDFAADVVPLAEYYVQKGLRVAVVDLQDVFDEFSYGIYDPQAIHDFLAYAYEFWASPAPSYVLLVGDGHYDFKYNRGFGGKSIYIPPYLAMVDPYMGETVANNRYVCVSGDDPLPDMHLGLFPVNSITETQAMVEKSLDYQQNPPDGGWNLRPLFVADNIPDPAGNFISRTEQLINDFLPAPYVEDTIFANDYCGPPTNPPQSCPAARDTIIEAMNEGRLLVNYIGHASQSAWAAETIFSVSHLGLLANDMIWPVMLPMACLDGYYINPVVASGTNALGESVVRVNGKGAIASWSPTGLGVVTGHHYLDEGFFEAVFDSDIRELGIATTYGKFRLYSRSGGAYLDLLDTYLLFGDPALRINTLNIDLQMQLSVQAPTQVAPGDVLTYTLTFTNAGPAIAHRVVVSDTLPALLVDPVVISTSSEVISQSVGLTFTWTITDLLPHTGGMIRFQARVDPALQRPFTIIDRAFIRSTTPDNNPVDNEASVAVGSDMHFIFLPLVLKSYVP